MRDEGLRLQQTAKMRFKLRISHNRKYADENCPGQFL